MESGGDGKATDGLAVHYSARAANEKLESPAREAAMLFAVAESHLDNEEDEDAMRAAAKALVLFREIDDRDAIADTVRIMVHVLRYQDKRKAATKVVKEYLAMFQARDDEKGIAKMLLSLAEANADRRGQTKRGEALRTATEALEMFRTQGNKSMQGYALIEIANMHTKRIGDPKELAEVAMEAAQEAQEIFVELGDKRMQMTALHCIAASHALAEDFGKAVAFSNDAMDIMQELGLRKIEAYELQAISEWYKLAGKFAKALPYAEEAAELFRETHAHPFKEASAIRNLVEVRIKMARESLDMEAEDRCLKAALKVCKEAHVRFEDTDFRPGVAMALSMQATVYQELDDKEETLRCAELAMAEYRDLGNRKNQAEMFLLIAHLYLDKEMYQKGLLAAQGCLEIYRDIGAPQNVATALLIIVKLLKARGEFKMAAQRAAEGRSIMVKAEDSVGEAQMSMALAEVQMAAEDYRGALRSAADAREIWEEYENDAELAKALLTVAQAHFKNTTSGRKAATLGSRPWNEGIARALRAAREAASIAKEARRPQLRAGALITIAEVHTSNQAWQECVEVSNEAVLLCRDCNEAPQEATALLLSATAYYEMDLPKDAKAAAEEAFDISLYLGKQEEQAMAEALLAKMQPKQQQQMVMMQPEAAQPQGVIPFVPKGSQQQQQQQQGSKQEVQRTAGDKLTSLSHEAVMAKVKEVTLSLIGEENEDELELDSPLMSIGLTSGTAVLLRDVLLEEIPGIKLAPTLIFDYPSVAAITELIEAQSA